MKKFLGSVVLIAGIAVVLTLIYTGITHFQQNSPGSNDKTKPAGKFSQTDNTVFETSSDRTEKREVEVRFSDGEKNFEFKSVPLFQITYKDGKEVEVVADGDMARALVDKLPESSAGRTPLPAKLGKADNGVFSKIIRGEKGYSIDKEKTLDELEKTIKDGARARVLDVGIVMKETEGENGFSGTAMNMGFKELIASFSTLHPGHIEDPERNTNLRIAAGRIDGVIIPPGGKFSFNKVVGPRTAKYGFEKAGVISQGKVIPGMGGGICQVSTTLYRAVLMSGMKINERHNHSIYDGIDYADRGLDAAVAWGYKDFCFTNNLKFPVLISCSSGKGSVTLALYAEQKPYDSVVLETRNEVKHPFRVEKKTNKKLKKGETKIVHPGVDGYSVEAFRIVTDNGKTKEERLSKDKYLTFNRIEESNN